MFNLKFHSRRKVSPPADSKHRRDRGNTLPEVIVAIALTGFAVSAVIGGMRMVILTSISSDEQAKTEALLTSAADRLTAANYIPCPGSAYGDYSHFVAAAATTVNWDASQIQITGLEFWDASAGGTFDASGDPIESDGGWSLTNSLTTAVECNPDINLTTSRTLQKLTIEVKSPSGDITRTIEVVKSPLVADPAAA